jgi:hypothetical protein
MKSSASPSLQEHISLTYHLLRVGVGVLALSLPVVLALFGATAYGLNLQDSISAYYHAFVPTAQFPDRYALSGNGLMRNWFVGILWAIGFFLILYKGFGRRESRALNLAGLLLIMVSMFPMGWTCRDACPQVSLHGVSAILFFLAIGYVCIFRSGDTLVLLPERQQSAYRKIYRIIGLTMWIFPLTVAVLEAARVKLFGSHTIFFVEAVGIWTFASFWLIKSREIALSGADMAATSGKLMRPTRKKGVIRYWLDTSPLTIAD